MINKKIVTNEVKDIMILNYIYLFTSILNGEKKYNIKDITHTLLSKDNLEYKMVKELEKNDDGKYVEFNIKQNTSNKFKGYSKKSIYKKILLKEVKKITKNPLYDKEQQDVENANIMIRNVELELFKRVFKVLFETNIKIIKIYENNNITIDKKLEKIKDIFILNQNDKILLRKWQELIYVYNDLMKFAIAVKDKEYKWSSTESVAFQYVRNIDLIDKGYTDLNSFIINKEECKFYYEFCNS